MLLSDVSYSIEKLKKLYGRINNLFKIADKKDITILYDGYSDDKHEIIHRLLNHN